MPINMKQNQTTSEKIYLLIGIIVSSIVILIIDKI